MSTQKSIWCAYLFLLFLGMPISLHSQTPDPSDSLSYPFVESIKRTQGGGYWFLERAYYPTSGWVDHPGWDMNVSGTCCPELYPSCGASDEGTMIYPVADGVVVKSIQSASHRFFCVVVRVASLFECVV